MLKLWFHLVRACTGAPRWKKAAKCKRLIEEARNRLIIARKRRAAVMSQSRNDIAGLLEFDQFDKAIARVEQLYKNQCVLSAYDLIDQFCLCIATNIPLISTESLECLPSDVREAISSLVFAASRCGELHELNFIRFLFRERFGSKFDEGCINLHTGSAVNSKIKQCLCIRSLSNDERLKLINQIATEHRLQLPKSSLVRHPKLPEYEDVVDHILTEVESCLDNID